MSLADPLDRRQPNIVDYEATLGKQRRELERARPGVGEPANAIAQISRSRTTETRNGGAGAARGAVNEARSARLLSSRPVSWTVPLPPPSYPLILPFATPRLSPLHSPTTRAFGVFLVL